MATRLYFSLEAPVVAPAFDASWEVTGSAVRRRLFTAKIDAALENIAVTTASNTPAGAVDGLMIQATSDPLSSGVTISGNIQGQSRFLENNAAADMRVQCVIWVMKPDGTSRGTLIASNASALSHEFNTSLRNISIPLGGSTAPTSVACSAGDRIVVEIGFRKHENATNSRQAQFTGGNVAGGTDLAIDETTTTANQPWIEFTEALSFTTDAMIASEYVDVLVAPTSAQAQIASEYVDVLMSPTDALAQVAQVYVDVLYPSSNPTTTFDKFKARIIG